jgi:hypothetical protein
MTDEELDELRPSTFAIAQEQQVRHVLGPAGLQKRNPNLVGGDVGGGTYRLDQVIFRPAPSLSPYRTPLRGLYLGSSATFPGRAVHGVCSDAAANAALADERVAARAPCAEAGPLSSSDRPACSVTLEVSAAAHRRLSQARRGSSLTQLTADRFPVGHSFWCCRVLTGAGGLCECGPGSLDAPSSLGLTRLPGPAILLFDVGRCGRCRSARP